MMTNLFCKDCANKQISRGLLWFLESDSCARPSIPPDPVTGKDRAEYCSVERRDIDKCGPSGKFFVLKASAIKKGAQHG